MKSIKQTIFHWKYQLYRIFAVPVLEFYYKYARKPITTIDKETWKKNSQAGEFAFHKRDTWRQSDDFIEQTKVFFTQMGYNANQFSDQVVVDLGAGSKMRGKYFQNNKLIAIEPMAEDCLREIPWSDLNDADKLYSQPAEDLIPELVNNVDFVFSINVLDHCYNFDEIVKNVFLYLKPGAEAFFSFDEHYITDKMHPLVLNDEICDKIFLKTGFSIKKMQKGFEGELYERLKRHNYGHGNYCLNYWLVKPK